MLISFKRSRGPDHPIGSLPGRTMAIAGEVLQDSLAGIGCSYACRHPYKSAVRRLPSNPALPANVTAFTHMDRLSGNARHMHNLDRHRGIAISQNMSMTNDVSVVSRYGTSRHVIFRYDDPMRLLTHSSAAYHIGRGRLDTEAFCYARASSYLTSAQKAHQRCAKTMR